jgi:dihydropteroate synthase
LGDAVGMKLRLSSRTINLPEVAVVGILNVTPDSYVDGGKYLETGAAVARAKAILDQGGDIIEIGGESTGPGSQPVFEHEEKDRILPVVRAVREAFPEACICIDTCKSGVAEGALREGADMINDVTAGRADSYMFDVISRFGCPCVLMYAKDETPRTTREIREYADVVADISAFLETRIAEARSKDVDQDRIILDPGLGHFVSADPRYSFEILRRLGEFAGLGPVMVSPSRKSFLAGEANLPVSKRLPATLAATTAAVMNGASFIRTHDVRETRLVCDAALRMKA